VAGQEEDGGGVKQKLKTGEEVDAVCARQWYHWKPGTLRKIKRVLNKRFRREGKEDTRRDC
jgi:hypothetical protein